MQKLQLEILGVDVQQCWHICGMWALSVRPPTAAHNYDCVVAQVPLLSSNSWTRGRHAQCMPSTTHHASEKSTHLHVSRASSPSCSRQSGSIANFMQRRRAAVSSDSHLGNFKVPFHTWSHFEWNGFRNIGTGRCEKSSNQLQHVQSCMMLPYKKWSINEISMSEKSAGGCNGLALFWSCLTWINKIQQFCT